MSKKLISDERTIQSVAYDLALAIATKDPTTTTPELLLAKIEALLPECSTLVAAKFSEENPPLKSSVSPLRL